MDVSKHNFHINKTINYKFAKLLINDYYKNLKKYINKQFMSIITTLLS